MARVKRGVTSHAKHKKVLASTKGYRGSKNRLIKVAKEAAFHAGAYAYHGRKRKKRDFRRLWILRIGEAVSQNGLSYNRFMNALKTKNILINRKILSDLALNDRETFNHIVDTVKG
jgi:large subunit ribosomal protein L20